MEIGGEEKVSAAAILLFGKDPQRFFPRARIRFIRFEGKTAEVGTRMNVFKDIKFNGRLLEQVQQATAFVRTQIREYTKLGEGAVFQTFLFFLLSITSSLPNHRIIGEGYKVEFYRLSERTIDRMCDALNGWYNVWTKFRCDYEDEKGTLSIVVCKPEEADKILKIMSDIQPLSFEREGTLSVPDVARIKMESIIDLHMTAEREKPSVLSELKRLSRNSPHGKNTPKEMEI